MSTNGLTKSIDLSSVQYANSDLYNFRASVSTREFMTNLSPLSARSRVVESHSPRFQICVVIWKSTQEKNPLSAISAERSLLRPQTWNNIFKSTKKSRAVKDSSAFSPDAKKYICTRQAWNSTCASTTPWNIRSWSEKKTLNKRALRCGGAVRSNNVTMVASTTRLTQIVAPSRNGEAWGHSWGSLSRSGAIRTSSRRVPYGPSNSTSRRGRSLIFLANW